MTAGNLAEHLLDRWLADAAVLAPEAGSQRWLAEGARLVHDWSQGHRTYHGIEHLAEVLDALDELSAADQIATTESLLARVIAWYHDVVYDPRARAGSNEQRSAAMARDHLHHLGVGNDWVDAVEHGVLMTQAHDVDLPAMGRSAPSAVLNAFHDADLWILSSPAERYAAYRAQVRAEYRHIPDDLFRSGRAQIMGTFAARPRIYRTEHAHEHWTARARINLAGELADLGQEPPGRRWG